jgi:hypothetical protein
MDGHSAYLWEHGNVCNRIAKLPEEGHGHSAYLCVHVNVCNRIVQPNLPQKGIEGLGAKTHNSDVV